MFTILSSSLTCNFDKDSFHLRLFPHTYFVLPQHHYNSAHFGSNHIHPAAFLPLLKSFSALVWYYLFRKMVDKAPLDARWTWRCSLWHIPSHISVIFLTSVPMTPVSCTRNSCLKQLSETIFIPHNDTDGPLFPRTTFEEHQCDTAGEETEEDCSTNGSDLDKIITWTNPMCASKLMLMYHYHRSRTCICNNVSLC